jgi:phasin
MSEAIQSTPTRSKAKSISGPSGSPFEFPKFEMPKFEMPQMEVPAAFREFAEKSVSQAKETYERMKSAAEEATDVLEDTYATASKGATDYGLRVIEAARANTNAAFDYYSQLLTLKTYSEVLELSTAHARKQVEAVVAQTKDLSALAQKVMVDSAEPVKDSVTKAFKKVS